MRLKVSDVTFRYRSVPALKDVTMETRPPEIIALVGPNGSGKSTLLKCLDRILRPQQGDINIDGTSLKRLSQSAIARHLSYVPQSVTSSFPVTVFEAVLLGRRPHIHWQSSEQDIKAALKAISDMGLEALAMRDFNELSGGERQRVLLARALAQEAGTLLLDEPTSNLDIRHQIEVMELIRRLVGERNLSVIMAIHDLNLAARFADRVIMLDHGRIRAAGRAQEVLVPDNIAASYGVHAAIRNENGFPVIIPLSVIADQTGSRQP